MDKSLLVQVIVNLDDAGDKQKVHHGTGYPIAGGRVLTAGHVIGNATIDKIEFSWYHHISDQDWKKCTRIVWDGRPEIDAVVLEADCPEGLNSRFGLLWECEPESDQSWESEGFPLVGKRGAVSTPLKGTTYSMGPADNHFHLGIDHATTMQNGWRGASGSPVFVDGKILGLIVLSPDNFGNGRFQALPVARLLKNEKFREAAGLTEDDQRKTLVSGAIDRLATSKVALETLAKALSVQLSDKSKDSCRLVIEKLMEQPSAAQMLNAMIREMNKLDKKQDKAGADCIEQVAYLLIPASLSLSRVKEISMVMQFGDTHVAFNAKTKAMVETAIARINGREIKFRTLASATDKARGVFCLEEPPEEGMDEDGEKFIDNFVVSLSTMVGEDLLGRTRDTKIRAINSKLEFDFARDGWQYYYVFEYPKQDQERKVRFALAQKLAKLFPRLAVVGLDRSDSHDEENDLVLRMNWILCRAAGIEYKPHG